MTAPEPISGISEVADRYDGFLFDIYGVIHDGFQCFPDAVECLRQLHEAGKPYAFLSNMPRRAGMVSAALIKFGMPAELATSALTSGEAVYRSLKADTTIGRRYYFQGPERTKDILEGLDLEQVSQVDAADFILVTGIGDHETPEDYADLLTTALAQKMPMICANPDLRVGRGDKLVSCAGLLANAYEEMGGPVHWMGKPHPDVFHMAAELLHADKLMMVGDSLRTDMAGAQKAGLDTLFIQSGIHSNDFAAGETVASLCDSYGIYPTATVDRIVW